MSGLIQSLTTSITIAVAKSADAYPFATFLAALAAIVALAGLGMVLSYSLKRARMASQERADFLKQMEKRDLVPKLGKANVKAMYSSLFGKGPKP